jgi:hypothetical protein
LTFLARRLAGNLGGLEKDFFLLWQDAIMITTYAAPVEQAMRFTFASLNERQRRIYAATESLKLGHGGIVYLAELLGCHRRTIERGLNELRQADALLPPQRARKKGADDNAA